MQTMLNGVTTTVTGNPFAAPSGGAYQATVVGTGAVGATVVFEASIDANNWLTLATLTLAGTTSASDGAISDGDLMRVRRGRGLAGSARPAFRRPPPFRPPRTAARPLLQLLLAHGALRSTGCSVWC